MHATRVFPFDLRWDSHDLADAVPLRLSELLRFESADVRPCANRAHSPRDRRAGYMPATRPAAFFRVRG